MLTFFLDRIDLSGRLLHADNNRTLKDTCGVLCKSGEVVEQSPHHHPTIILLGQAEAGGSHCRLRGIHHLPECCCVLNHLSSSVAMMIPTLS